MGASNRPFYVLTLFHKIEEFHRFQNAADELFEQQNDDEEGEEAVPEDADDQSTADSRSIGLSDTDRGSTDGGDDDDEEGAGGDRGSDARTPSV